MPTYQYACTACDERLEAVQKFTDDPLTVCEACGGRLRKLFSAVGIVFKGSGFYRTDSRSGSNGSSGPGSASKETKDSPAAASNGSEAKSGSGAPAGDSKPAKKADTAGASAPATGTKVA